MPTLPWTKLSEGPTDSDATVMASRFVLQSRRHVPAFLRAAMRIRRQVKASPGALGVSLIAEPFKATFWTLSAWRDRRALDDFVQKSPHVENMKRFHERMRDARFKFWTVPSSGLPVAWTDAKARLVSDGDVLGPS
jgi:hypothetical protein